MIEWKLGAYGRFLVNRYDNPVLDNILYFMQYMYGINTCEHINRIMDYLSHKWSIKHIQVKRYK